MNKTILFFLALMLVTTTACGRGNSNNNPVKEETMTTEGDGKVIHLTRADFWRKYIISRKTRKSGNMKVTNRLLWISMLIGVVLANGSSYSG